MDANARNISSADKQEMILQGYEALSERSSRMLDSARQEDWMTLVQEESRYVIDVEKLTRLERGLVTDGIFHERKTALLERILEQDKEVRQRLVARRDKLDELIGEAQGNSDCGALRGQVIEARQTFGPSGSARHDPEGQS